MIGEIHSYRTVKKLYLDWVRLATESTGLNTNLILGVIMQESAGNPLADNRPEGEGDCIGLMQVGKAALSDYNEATGDRLDFVMLLRPDVNIRVGSWYLRQMHKMFGWDRGEALRAYNVGPGTVRHGGTIGGSDGSAYRDSVLRHMAKFAETP